MHGITNQQKGNMEYLQELKISEIRWTPSKEDNRKIEETTTFNKFLQGP